MKAQSVIPGLIMVIWVICLAEILTALVDLGTKDV